ncbi:ATP-grasp domain-containing protein [Bacillus sp. EB106-08-02-XG196]|uniref:ATP-grasp domain-containing protein n=1 Tax=Bacillus sp. EB106-08-02-XG196 TaxID=2737049 RepID=UPI0015C4D67E|nr:ATP-grasp domain-containing protein [Bacillus sp. EB106-08-02-XG196]NWQ41340.1 ATP-grasp domain-containing protein [Bacillus sp. EB106-08-02-XG196]
MKSIVFLGTNKTGSSYEGIRAAKSLGYETILLTNRTIFIEEKEGYKEIDDARLIDMSDTDEIFLAITDLMNEGKIVDCFISFLDEYVYLAALLTNVICNTPLTYEPLEIMTDKILTREFLSGKNYTPFFKVLSSPETIENEVNELNDQFPLIIKSPQSNGSKDVLLVGNIWECKRGVKQLLRKNSELPILVEEYLEGPQYLIEVMVYHSTITIVAIVEQEVTKGERFIITGYSICPKLLLEQLPGLKETVYSIIEDFQFRNGTCHLEMKLTNKGWKLIEINPRMAGGAMNRMIEEAFGVNLAEQTIRLYAGNEPDLIRRQEKAIYAQYLIVSSIGKLLKVSGCDSAEEQAGVIEVYTKAATGQIVTPPRSMGQRYGYVLAAADSKSQARKCAINGAQQIQFYLLPI